MHIVSCASEFPKTLYQQLKKTIKWPFQNVNKTRIVIYPRNYIVMVSCEQQIKIVMDERYKPDMLMRIRAIL